MAAEHKVGSTVLASCRQSRDGRAEKDDPGQLSLHCTQSGDGRADDQALPLNNIWHCYHMLYFADIIILSQGSFQLAMVGILAGVEKERAGHTAVRARSR